MCEFREYRPYLISGCKEAVQGQGGLIFIRLNIEEEILRIIYSATG